MAFLGGLYEKQRDKLTAQMGEHLQPGESVQRALLGRANKTRSGRQIAVFATDRNVYAAEVRGISKLKAPAVAFPIANARAQFGEDGAVVVANYSRPVLAAQDEAEHFYEHYTIYPEKAAGSGPDDLVRFIGDRTTEPERRT